MSKVLIVNSSARKNSNTRLMSAKVAEGATANNHTVKTIEIGRASIMSCIGCDTCQTKTPGACIFNDDMTKFYPAIMDADVVVFSSPIYFFTMNAQAKAFIDRTYAIGAPAFADKRIGGVFAYAALDAETSGCFAAAKTLQDICEFFGAEWIGTVHASAGAEGAVSGSLDILRDAETFGAAIK